MAVAVVEEAPGAPLANQALPRPAGAAAAGGRRPRVLGAMNRRSWRTDACAASTAGATSATSASRSIRASVGTSRVLGRKAWTASKPRQVPRSSTPRQSAPAPDPPSSPPRRIDARRKRRSGSSGGRESRRRRNRLGADNTKSSFQPVAPVGARRYHPGRRTIRA